MTGKRKRAQEETDATRPAPTTRTRNSKTATSASVVPATDAAVLEIPIRESQTMLPPQQSPTRQSPTENVTADNVPTSKTQVKRKAPATNNKSTKAAYRVSKTSAASAKVEMFREYFEDPPNVEELRNRIIAPAPLHSQVAEDSDGGLSESGGVGSSTRIRSPQYRGLQLNATRTNIERIFIATEFLVVNLREKARLDDPNFRFSMSKEGHDFKALAEDLERNEPSLKGVTGYALHSLYSRLVEKRRELENFVKTATGDPWTKTNMAGLAWDLVAIADEIKLRDQRKAAEKENLVVAADALERQVTLRAMTTMGSRSTKASRNNLNHQTVYQASNRSQPQASSSAQPPSSPSVPTSSFFAQSMTSHPVPVPSESAVVPSLPIIPALPRGGSRSSIRSGKSLFADEEQERFKEESNTRMATISNVIAEMSSTLEKKIADAQTSNARFEEKFETMSAKFQTSEVRFQTTEVRFVAIETSQSDLKTDLTYLRWQVGNQSRQIDSLQTAVKDIQNSVKELAAILQQQAPSSLYSQQTISHPVHSLSLVDPPLQSPPR
ncbi:hypothetical protein BGZ49_004448 [Haplosporangium sp. Z 27]|nr:hypothetical protein BGZ49_004448 [Haplosporangium sp. Z 27]